MLRYFITFLYIVTAIVYLSFPLQAKFRQPQWDDFNTSLVRKTDRLTVRSRLHAQFRKWKGVRYQW